LDKVTAPTPENFGQLRQQVIGLEQGHADLRRDLQNVAQNMSDGFSAISAKLDNKTTPQWQAYGLIITVLIALGGALYWPVKENDVKHETQIETIRTQLMPRVEIENHWRAQGEKDTLMDQRIQRQFDELVRLEKAHSYLDGQFHPIKDH
jgi:hypothetical protein